MRILALLILASFAAEAQSPVIEGFGRALDLATRVKELQALEAQERVLKLYENALRRQQGEATQATRPAAPRRDKIRACVVVSGEDAEFASAVESSFSKEIRALGDIQTAQDNCAAILRLDLLKLATPSGVPPMYLMSYVASSLWSKEDLDFALYDVSPKEMRSAIAEAMGSSEIYYFHGAAPVNAEHLNTVAKQMAVALDAKMLKFIRGR